MKRLSVILAVLLLVSVAFTASAEEKILLQYNPDPGTTTKYKMNIKGSTVVTASSSSQNQQTNLETAMIIQQKVTGKDKAGDIDMETRILEGKITVNGTPTTIPSVGEIITVKMKKDGTIISRSGMDQGGMGNNQQVKFPTNPVGVGDSWTVKMEPNPEIPIPMETVYTVEAFEKVGGEDCVRLKSEVSTPKYNAGINIEVKANGRIWFAYKKGYMLQNEVVSNMKMIMLTDVGNNKSEKITTVMKLSLKMGLAK